MKESPLFNNFRPLLSFPVIPTLKRWDTEKGAQWNLKLRTLAPSLVCQPKFSTISLEKMTKVDIRTHPPCLNIKKVKECFTLKWASIKSTTASTRTIYSPLRLKESINSRTLRLSTLLKSLAITSFLCVVPWFLQIHLVDKKVLGLRDLVFRWNSQICWIWEVKAKSQQVLRVLFLPNLRLWVKSVWVKKRNGISFLLLFRNEEQCCKCLNLSQTMCVKWYLEIKSWGLVPYKKFLFKASLSSKER